MTIKFTIDKDERTMVTPSLNIYDDGDLYLRIENKMAAQSPCYISTDGVLVLKEMSRARAEKLGLKLDENNFIKVVYQSILNHKET